MKSEASLTPFKEMFNPKTVRRIARMIANTHTSFDSSGFVDDVLGDLDKLELKARVEHITIVLRKYLHPDYPRAVKQILACLGPELSSTQKVTSEFDYWPFCHFVEKYGLDHFQISFQAMVKLTKRFSAEFAIRPYLESQPKKVLVQLKKCTRDSNVHVRRWVSEGTRPRLPWGRRLRRFEENPQPVLNLLELLKDDPEEYVRKSVANNLNDIAKDHPELVIQTAQRWLQGADTKRERLVKHALRTLVKQGHQGALSVLGYKPPKVDLSINVKTPRVKLGGNLQFEVELVSRSNKTQELLIDYAVYHLRANQSLSPKVFKWTKQNLPARQALVLSRKHPMHRVTTRTYYAGQHQLEVIVNGKKFGLEDFQLQI